MVYTSSHFGSNHQSIRELPIHHLNRRRLMAAGRPGVGEIHGLQRCAQLNGLMIHVMGIYRDGHGDLRYRGNIDPQHRCPDGRPDISIRCENVIFSFRQESKVFRFNPYNVMADFGAQDDTPMCAIRFSYYHDRPTKADVKSLFGHKIYTIQRQALQQDYERMGRGWWKRAGAMFQGGPDSVKDGMVFTTSEKENQTSPLTALEAGGTPSTCLWWPALIAQHTTPGYMFVRCVAQNQEHRPPWVTPAPRCHVFDDIDIEELEDGWQPVDPTQIGQLFDV